MPIPQTCPSCKGAFNIPDNLAGKPVKCPHCKGVVRTAAASSSNPGSGKAESWTVKTADGQEYGPVTRSDLDQWLAEGRLTAECQVLKKGSAQWQWASDVYPSLAAAESPPEVPQFGISPSPAGGAIAVPSSPSGPSSSPFGDPNPYGAVSSASGAPAVRPRNYPMLKMVQTLSYVIAGLLGLTWLAMVGVIVMGGALGISGQGGAASLVAMVASLLVVTVYFGAMIMYVLAGAEMIQLFMDVQSNTQEAAHFSRQMANK